MYDFQSSSMKRLARKCVAGKANSPPAKDVLDGVLLVDALDAVIGFGRR